MGVNDIERFIYYPKEQFEIDSVLNIVQISQVVMAGSTTYTRAYSTSSHRQLVSGKGPAGIPLSHRALHRQFQRHAKKSNRVPTALVSVSGRIVDTVKRACDLHWIDGELPANVWITSIEVPLNENRLPIRIHSAKRLAERCNIEQPNRLKHEFVFEWAIPDEYVIHEVSLQTLFDRGLIQEWFDQPSTLHVRCCIAAQLEGQCAWEFGVTLGLIAKLFGARAPVDWIAHRVLDDCVKSKILCDDYVELRYPVEAEDEFDEMIIVEDSVVVDLEFLQGWYDGIDDTLIHDWLADLDFFQRFAQFEQWRDDMEDDMMWQSYELWAFWHEAGECGTAEDLSLEDCPPFEEQKEILSARHEILWAEIEAEAVKIGL